MHWLYAHDGKQVVACSLWSPQNDDEDNVAADDDMTKHARKSWRPLKTDSRHNRISHTTYTILRLVLAGCEPERMWYISNGPWTACRPAASPPGSTRRVGSSRWIMQWSDDTRPRKMAAVVACWALQPWRHYVVLKFIFIAARRAAFMAPTTTTTTAATDNAIWTRPSAADRLRSRKSATAELSPPALSWTRRRKCITIPQNSASRRDTPDCCRYFFRCVVKAWRSPVIYWLIKIGYVVCVPWIHAA